MWTAFWVATVILTYRSLAPNAAYGLSVYLIFSFYWTAQVIKNVVHMTISGVCASVYFLQGSEYGMPANPTLTASKRYALACTPLDRPDHSQRRHHVVRQCVPRLPPRCVVRRVSSVGH